MSERESERGMDVRQRERESERGMDVRQRERESPWGRCGSCGEEEVRLPAVSAGLHL